jgi:hypothetical protein
LSSSTVKVVTHPKAAARPVKKRVGRRRKLDKRVESKPDGRYLIYYKPS